MYMLRVAFSIPSCRPVQRVRLSSNLLTRNFFWKSLGLERSSIWLALALNDGYLSLIQPWSSSSRTGSADAAAAVVDIPRTLVIDLESNLVII